MSYFCLSVIRVVKENYETHSYETKNSGKEPS